MYSICMCVCMYVCVMCIGVYMYVCISHVAHRKGLSPIFEILCIGLSSERGYVPGNRSSLLINSLVKKLCPVGI